MRSSSTTPKCQETIHTNAHNRKTQEAQAIPMPTRPRKNPKYEGCLEMAKTPLDIGSPSGAVINEMLNIRNINSPKRQIGRPTKNHNVPNFSGKNML